MAPYDDWNRTEDDDEEELQDSSLYEGKRDVVLFCIDCSPSMYEMREDDRFEDVQTCGLMLALESAMQIMKRKVLVGPNDAVGIMLFNTTKRNESGEAGADIKKGTYVYQPIATIDAPKVMELVRLIDEARENPDVLRETFPPMTEGRVPVGDVFTSCNWVMRDGAPKTATKRIFFITDEDNPHPGAKNARLMTSARTTLFDLMQAGVTVEPFFIGTDEKPFDPTKFYSSVLLPTNITELDEITDDGPAPMLPESISITRVEELLDQMRFHEVPKRALFSVPFTFAPGLTIGVKGYGLITEQKKGAYRYFADLGDRVEPVISRTAYVDEERDAEADKTEILYGMDLGAPSVEGEDGEDAKESEVGTRAVALGSRVFYTAEEVRSFRTLGLEPGIKLLGFKPRSELAFEDNVKHSIFIYPDEMSYSGSKRTFTALLRTMIKKKKIAIVLALTRRNSSPIFCAVLPQAEKVEESGWREPPGFHLIPLPFADDIRAAPDLKGFRASEDLRDIAGQWIHKLKVKNGSYPPDSYPNPALAYHNAQLEASAFREDFDPEAFEDLTMPKYDMMHKRAGQLMREWKTALLEDETANVVSAPTAGRKRKAADTDEPPVDEDEIRRLHDSGQLRKLRVEDLKQFLRSKGLPVSGKKDDLVQRTEEYCDAHPRA
ncbi:ku70-like protein [Trametes coccinea BRFM310]|uniref:ATP-dependent DNA helicase II subunit 1 n=1 Tax=Trametes coccinea (strain BRFM310) TaxID=1353009 RepID=A0A1Y2IAL7_TRAC3|nr:ku70-like protein [Trametes coccinea BRFM310]